MELSQEKCVPCEGGVPAYTAAEIAERMPQLQSGWSVVDGKKIQRNFEFKDFRAAIVFVNTLADIAEENGHHPDIHVFYNKVLIELWTHAIGGLSINDFIIAANADKIYSAA